MHPVLTVALADLCEHVGADLGATGWTVVDQPRIDAFGEVTDDRQWIHVDPEHAASGPFGGTIAHGYLTLSLVSSFLLELLVITDARSAVNYGLDRVRFPSPVPAGASLRGRGELLAAERRNDATVQTTTRIAVEIGGGAKPAMVADVLTRFCP